MFRSKILAFESAVLTFIHTSPGRETKQVLSHTGTLDNKWPSCLQLATKVSSFGKVTCWLPCLKERGRFFDHAGHSTESPVACTKTSLGGQDLTLPIYSRHT